MASDEKTQEHVDLDTGKTIIVTDHGDGNKTYVEKIDPIKDVPDVTKKEDK